MAKLNIASDYSGQKAGNFNNRYFGMYTAIVTNNQDPDDMARIKINIPTLHHNNSHGVELWARLATMSAGPNRGSYFLPEVDDEVLVAFEAGDPAKPFIVGSLWNGQDSPPFLMDGAGLNERKGIVSRNGNKLELIDKNGHEICLLETPAGQRLQLSDGDGGSVILAMGGGSEIVMLSDGSVRINAASSITLNASTVKINSSKVDLNSAMVNVSGTVKCETIIANSVVGSSYTPGAGNIY